ncbi:MAG: cytochrome c [Hydrocarboniphaga sp.]|uniref:c-type cytochrome n=1 Tax=Hydrocarboniphaga sp. TaxID=2033016 RepID=UPI002629D1C6|nr:cytochrome c [Hydrocarboniphaga sp.]MDB5969276.1 cytochrome c [Hydrocarboniphaga sp.]
MSLHRKFVLISAAALVLGLSVSARADEHEAAAAPAVDKLVPVCQSCHGEHGAKPILPEYPVLAGQYANYIEHALKDYRSGARKNAVMRAQAANLTDTDIAAVAQYFAHQQGPIYTFTLPPAAAK